jgi:hypothetical protein
MSWLRLAQTVGWRERGKELGQFAALRFLQGAI